MHRKRTCGEDEGSPVRESSPKRARGGEEEAVHTWSDPRREGVVSWQRAAEPLGSGSFGVVYECMASAGGVRRLCALKRFRTDTSSDGPTDACVVREMHALCALPPHAHVLRAHAVVMHCNEVHLLTPMYSMDACRLVSTHFPRGMPEPLLCALARQLLSAVEHLHAHGNMHRDIKLENILVSADDGRFVLGDLGLCRNTGPVPRTSGSMHEDGVAHVHAHAKTTYVCTLWTRAPELCLLRTGAPRTYSYSHAVDVWSVGMTLLACARGEYAVMGRCDGDFLVNLWRVLGKPTDWELLSRAADNGNALASLPPSCFAAYGHVDRVRANLHAVTKRTDLSDEFVDLLVCLLQQVPTKRPTIAQALGHAFLGRMDDAAARACVMHEMQVRGIVGARPTRSWRAASVMLSSAASTTWMDAWTPPRVPLPRPSYVLRHEGFDLTMRTTLLGWMWEVALKFRISLPAFYDAVQLMDAFLSEQGGVRRSKLQLVGVAALALSSKLEDVEPPFQQDFVTITDRTYTRAEIAATEMNIARVMGMAFIRPPHERIYTHAMDMLLGNFHLAGFDHAANAGSLGDAARTREAAFDSVVTLPGSFACGITAICVFHGTAMWAMQSPRTVVWTAAYVAAHIAPHELPPHVLHIKSHIQAHAPCSIETCVECDVKRCVGALADIRTCAQICRNAVWVHGGIRYSDMPSFNNFAWHGVRAAETATHAVETATHAADVTPPPPTTYAAAPGVSVRSVEHNDTASERSDSEYEDAWRDEMSSIGFDTDTGSCEDNNSSDGTDSYDEA